MNLHHLGMLGVTAVALFSPIPSAQAAAYYNGTEGMKILWHFDDADGTTVTNAATSGADYNGTLNGNVSSDAAGLFGEAYQGFTSTTSYVNVDTTSSNNISWGSKSYTLELWVQNPKLDFRDPPYNWWDARTAVIARGGLPTANHDVAWQLDVQPNGAVRLSGSSYKAASGFHYDSTALTWNSDEWYYLAMTWDYKSNTDYEITVYRGVAGDQQVESILTATLSDAPKAGTSPNFAIGASGYSYYANPSSGDVMGAQGGYFGGQIDEVILWDGIRTEAELNRSLQMAVPEPASISLLGMAGVWVLCLRRRKNLKD